MGTTEHHFLIVTFPAQGHINPALQLAHRLLLFGANRVTLATAATGINRINNIQIPSALTLSTFSDGFDGHPDIGKIMRSDFQHYLSEIKRCGSPSLAKLIASFALNCRPITHIIYSTFNAWAGRVARENHIPATLLWDQPVVVFAIYYYYFNGYRDQIRNSDKDELGTVKLPGLPPLYASDLPSYLHHDSTDDIALAVIEEHMQVLKEEKSKPKVLVNSFNELEIETIKAMEDLDVIEVGPLIPPKFIDEKMSSNCYTNDLAVARLDLYKGTRDCVQWLNTKPASSLIYVSFGSFSVLPKPQMDEIGRALLAMKKPFLWVMRNLSFSNGEEVISYRHELEELGMIVPWCSQLEVLSHRAVGCFVTHCGWNSTLESLVFSAPVVAFPLSMDQTTNAKMVEDVWGVGVRVVRHGKGLVGSEEIGRCLEMVMGGGRKGEEVRLNSLKWKEMARAAIIKGGSSDNNLKAFVNWVQQD